MPPILVVDDDPDYREFLMTVLERSGVDGIGAASGAEALDILERQPCAGAIVDIVMAGMDGLELVRALRAAGRTVPILTLTGGCVGQRSPYLNAALALGADMAACKGGSELGPIRALVERARAAAPA